MTKPLRIQHSGLANFLFLIAILIMAIFYNYHEIVELGPISRHYWRQSDGASLARCYYEEGMHFFQPKMHHMVGGDNSGVGEFPILYYFVAALYHLFGPEDAVFRLFNFAIFAGGLFLFFRFLCGVLERPLLALFPPLLLFSSPLLAYYGLNFLPNTSALGLLLAAAYLYYRYTKSGRLGWFYVAAGLVLLSALLKVSMLIPFLAFAGAGLICRMFFRRDRWAAAFPHWGHLLVSTGIILVGVAAWYLWARYYNELHNSGHFLTSVKPIWSMDPGYRTYTTMILTTEQWMMYFNGFTLGLFVVLLLLELLLPHRMPLPIYLMLCLLFLGSVAFVVLFYDQLAVHHYYIIDILPLPAFVFSLALWLIVRYWPGLTHTVVLYFGLFLFLALNIQESRAQLGQYYRMPSKYIKPVFVSLNKKQALEDFLRERGIHYPQKAISVPDISPNGTLYYFNLRGWNIGTNIGDRDVRQLVEWGAQYLIVVDATYLENAGFEEALAHPIGVFDERILFFDLSHMK